MGYRGREGVLGVLSGAIWAYGMGSECGWGVGLFWDLDGVPRWSWETSGAALGWVLNWMILALVHGLDSE